MLKHTHRSGKRLKVQDGHLSVSKSRTSRAEPPMAKEKNVTFAYPHQKQGYPARQSRDRGLGRGVRRDDF